MFRAAVAAQQVPMVPISSAGSPTPSHQYVPVRTRPEGIIKWQSAAYKHISSAVFASKEQGSKWHHTNLVKKKKNLTKKGFGI